MFVFDSGLNRILLFEKPVEIAGQLKHPKELWMEAQFIYKGERNDVFRDVKELASDYYDANLFVLDGNKIWKVMIK